MGCVQQVPAQTLGQGLTSWLDYGEGSPQLLGMSFVHVILTWTALMGLH